MGWLTKLNITEKKDIIAYITKPWNNKEHAIKDGSETYTKGRCLKQSCRGYTLWTIWGITKSNTETDRVIKEHTVILCDLLRKDDGAWGHKGMEETMGVYYYDCPISYLYEVPIPDNDNARKWREKVKYYFNLAKQIKNLEIGDKVLLEKGYRIREFCITSLKPFCGIPLQKDNNTIYKIKNKY